MRDETSAPFHRSGVSWKAVGQMLLAALPLAGAAAMLYLGTKFATHTEVEAAVAPLSPIPAKVQSLEEFRARQEKAQEKSENKFESVQQSLATLSAQQANTDKKVDRVLDALDRMNRRAAAATP